MTATEFNIHDPHPIRHYVTFAETKHQPSTTLAYVSNGDKIKQLKWSPSIIA